MENDRTISTFDRTRGALDGVALFARATTVKTVESVTGLALTFIIETARHELKDGKLLQADEDARYGDTIFIEALSTKGVIRIALPPKVANTIASQRESLTTRRRAAAGRARAHRDRLAGKVPGFMKHTKRAG